VFMGPFLVLLSAASRGVLARRFRERHPRPSIAPISRTWGQPEKYRPGGVFGGGLVQGLRALFVVGRHLFHRHDQSVHYSKVQVGIAIKSQVCPA
jgi:hypothetical protein